jgi:hypothetical protein
VLESVAGFFLNFSHDSVIIPVVILGYICLDRKTFSSAIKLTLLSMLFGCALKITFQIPLAPSTGLKGFAFPSGHMQSSVVLYGYLIKHTRSTIFKSLMSCLLIAIGLSLVYCGYHDYIDVLGGVFFAAILIFSYESLRIKKENTLKWALFFFASFLMLYINIRDDLMAHLWMAYYALNGLMISESLFSKYERSEKVRTKALAMLLCFSSLFTIQMLFKVEAISSLPIFLNQLQWAIIGFCVPLSSFVVNFIAGSMQKDKS